MLARPVVTACTKKNAFGESAESVKNRFEGKVYATFQDYLECYSQILFEDYLEWSRAASLYCPAIALTMIHFVTAGCGDHFILAYPLIFSVDSANGARTSS